MENGNEVQDIKVKGTEQREYALNSLPSHT